MTIKLIIAALLYLAVGFLLVGVVMGSGDLDAEDLDIWHCTLLVVFWPVAVLLLVIMLVLHPVLLLGKWLGQKLDDLLTWINGKSEGK